MLKRREFLSSLSAAAIVPMLGSLSFDMAAHAAVDKSYLPVIEIDDVQVAVGATHVDVTLRVAPETVNTVYAVLGTTNGSGWTRAIEGRDFEKADKLVTFQQGDANEQSVRIALTGKAKEGATFKVGLRGDMVQGANLGKNEALVTFVAAGEASAAAAANTPARAKHTPQKGEKTFTLEVDAIEASDTAVVQNRPAWRDRLAHGRTQDGNKELGYYAPNMWGVENGELVLDAKELPEPVIYRVNRDDRTFEYHSSILTSERVFKQKYGFFECEAKLPSARGTWSAFWLLPSDGSWPPEIDVLEQPNNGQFGPGDMSVGHHWGHREPGRHKRIVSKIYGRRLFEDNLNLQEGYHRYGVDWREDFTTWYLDGVEIFRAPTRLKKHCYMLVDVAVGGWGGEPDFSTGTTRMWIKSIDVWA